ncbi:MAG: nucleotidyl transferase AbiEii/AbiGii toxin family protein [Candidatus Woesebacteria bacterium]|nr:nucleotidyl transferase AbiEii/AbiGii toxin family protein [Candidatus Woesebacteria bacterium]
MTFLKSEDVLHKAELLKLLTGIIDNNILASNVYFKGGTCATMLGYLDRFSVDLDFDLKKGANKLKLLSEFKEIFKKLDFKIEKGDAKNLFFVLKYDVPKDQRNTLKLSVSDVFIKANEYKTLFFAEIDRLVACQTIETMFANKLVAPIDRYNKHEKIAGRDIYDIHHFFSNGYAFKKEIIEERMKMSAEDYFKRLIKFIENKVTDRLLSEDLNMLLPYDVFLKIRKKLKPETLIFLRSVVKWP